MGHAMKNKGPGLLAAKPPLVVPQFEITDINVDTKTAAAATNLVPSTVRHGLSTLVR